jgi:hypothetical protein
MARFGKENKNHGTTNYEHRIREYFIEKTTATINDLVDYLGIASYNLKAPLQRMVDSGELIKSKAVRRFPKGPDIYMVSKIVERKKVNNQNVNLSYPKKY